MTRFDIHLAMRNIWRTPRRTILMGLGVMVGTLLMVLTVGLMDGAHHRMIKFQSSMFTGYAQIQNPGYHSDPSLEHTIHDAAAVMALVEKMPIVQSGKVRVTDRLNSGALLSYGDASRGVQIMGIDMARERKFGRLLKAINRGKNFELRPGEVLVGKDLGEELGVTVGTEVVIVGFTEDGSLSPVLKKVGGFFDAGMQSIDRGGILMPIDEVRDMVELPGGATSIALFGGRPSNTAEIVREARVAIAGHPQLRVLSWEQLNPALQQYVILDDAGGWMMLIVIVLIIAIAAGNALLLSQLERTREFGLFLAIGLEPGNLIRVVLFENLLIVTAGVLIGTLGGGMLTWWFQQNPIPIPQMAKIAAQYGMEAIIPGEINFNVLVTTPLIMWSFSVVALVIIAQRIRKLKPLEALRYTA